MKKLGTVLLTVVILLGALILRSWGLRDRAPFDWDQNRDYQVVSRIAGGEVTLIGPVAKGELGFFLGPLYYYLLVPGYILLHGDLSALPLTAILLDVLAVLAMLMVLPGRWGKGRALFLAAVWSCSWLAIESARISWNVALVPLWTILSLALLTRPPTSRRGMLMFGLVIGLAWHIHAALIPLGALLALPFLIHSRRLSTWILFGFGYLLPLLPLILFDLRHGGLEHRLLLNFFQSAESVKGSWSLVIPAVISRLGKNVAALLGGAHDLNLTLGIGMSALAFLACLRGTTFARWAGLAVLLNILLALFLRDPGLPEYYLLAATLGSLIVLVDVLFHLPRLTWLAIPAFAIFLWFNVPRYTAAPTSFALGSKTRLVEHLATFPSPISVEYDLPFGREAGLSVLLNRAGLAGKGETKTHALVTEKGDETLFIQGEIAQDEGWYGGLRLGVRRVQ